uniref:AAA+ ATPase domain-containing protein n=1 Tax=Timema douglasi TaxID=61478 RepID=A0A7R8VGB1_TIMDO|nr:unnamed protein product [Timema douglasi]
MNSSTEIIPIQGPSMSSRKKPSGFLNKKPKKSYPYFSDSLLLPRIQQYLEDHKDIFTHVDIDAMADYLQNKYRDYSKKKRRPFRVMASEGNRANEQLMDLYYPQKPKKNPKYVGENELIDICSDDEPEPVKVVDVNKEMFSNSMPNISIVPIGLKPKKSSSNVTSSMTAKTLPSKTRTKSGTSSPPASLVNMPTPSMPEKPTRFSAALPANESTPQSSSGTGVKKRKPQLEENGFLPNKRRKEFTVSYSNVNFKDFAGHGKILEDVSSLIFHMSQIDSYRALGISPPRGFLLHGPPGCGKTLLAQVIAGELRVPLLKVSSPALVAGVSGESESRIRDLFDQALSLAPCVVFLDEVDAITPNRHTAQREMERRIVSQLLSCLDELGEKEGGNNVLVIGATNRPDSIDPALRRAGRFDREVSIGIPDTKARTQILKVACKNMKLEPSFNYKEVAKNAPGYVGADLIALAREASMIALERNKCLQKAKDNPKKTGNSSDMDISDEETAQPKVNSTDPLPVSENNREKPSGSEQGPLNQENIFSWVRRQPPLPRSEFINMSISMKDFKAALKRVQPSAKREGFATVPDGGASMRVVNQMLTEMDGVEGRGGVFLMAASNRPDIVDPAVLRPGRLDKILYVGLPSPVGRVDILRALTKVSDLGKNGTRPAFSKDNSLEQLGLSHDVEGYTGADLAALIREAGLHALMDFIDSPTEGKHNLEISRDHCSRALRRIRPSVTRKDQAHYEKYRRLYSAAQSKRIRTPVNKENTSVHEISSPGTPKAFGQSTGSHVSSSLKRPASSSKTHVTPDVSSHRGGCESSTAKVLKLLEETIEDDDDIMEVTPAANIVRVSDTEVDEIALLESNDEAEVLETTPTTDSTKVKDIAPDDVIALHEIDDSEALEECSLNNIAKKTDDITTNETSLSKSDENPENAKPDTLSEVNETSKESAEVDSEKASVNDIDEHAKVQTSV